MITDNGSYVNLWVDDARVGCGYRNFLVLQLGRRWARLLYMPTLTVIRVPMEKLEKAATETPGRSLAKRIQQLRRDRKRLGLGWSEAGVREALTLLEH